MQQLVFFCKIRNFEICALGFVFYVSFIAVYIWCTIFEIPAALKKGPSATTLTSARPHFGMERRENEIFAESRAQPLCGPSL